MSETTTKNILPNDGDVPARILVIDDEAVVCLSCKRILSGVGFAVETHQDSRKGLSDALTDQFDVILLDIVMPDLDGLEVLKQIKASGISAEVVMISGYSTVESAVQAMKRGAADYVSKPFTPDELRLVIQKVMERSALIRENLALRKQLEERTGFEGMIGDSRPMERIFSLIQRVARTDGTVLVTGESGTGKEMAARAVHQLSPRKNEAFIACDCSTLTPTLLESELFGHVKGSFSGAVASKKGLFEVAHKGTLFLDELANISMEIQGKLLRVLETRRVKKVGDAYETEVDIRLIGATNRDLQQMTADGEFREDLYYRLNVVPIYLPPLRERKGDIPVLAMTFLEQFRRKNPVKVMGFTPEAMYLMEAYHWPGNVRELKNIVERMAILCDSERIQPGDLPNEIRQNEPLPLPQSLIPRSWEQFKEYKRQVRDAAVQDVERRFLLEALEQSHGNVSRASEEVGMQRTQFHALMAKYGLQGEDV
ncbi:MAG: sigma-54-dependent Fis family transcriptional regulator [Candidatus Omnitrophica bacterium]|nr:sigma-54-dependent Fis family transcriptional regulator [Candidatus Omnitrophota bacterium]